MAKTRRKPGTLPPSLTPKQADDVRRCRPIGVRLAMRYARRNRVGMQLDDLLGPAEEAVTLAVTTHPGSKVPLDVYVWARVRSTLKTILKQTAERLGLQANDTVASRTAEAAGAALDDFALTLEDPGNVFRDAPEEQLAQLDEVAANGATAQVVGAGGHTWHQRGELGMVLHIDHLRKNKALHDEVARLPADKSTIIDLRYFQELPVKEVCARTGVSESTVARAIADAIPLLRARLKARGIDGG